jgi:hypothetical protein
MMQTSAPPSFRTCRNRSTASAPLFIDNRLKDDVASGFDVGLCRRANHCGIGHHAALLIERPTPVHEQARRERLPITEIATMELLR